MAIAGIVLLLLMAQTTGRAAPPQPPLPDALPYSNGFLVTGNYVVGGVDLTPQTHPANAEGFSTAEIPISISGVPAGGVNIVAAYLYYEAIHPYPVTSEDVDPTVGVKFRGMSLSPGTIRARTKQLTGNGATCWGSAGQGAFAVSMFRANVLTLLPKEFDSQGKWTGKYIVNSAELPVNAKHTVTLPEKTGDSAIQSAGATLFLVYRVLDPSEPLRKIVMFDGLYTAYGDGLSVSAAEGTTMSQKLRGFYKSAGQSARITHVVGTGGNNQTERIAVTSTQNNTITLGPPPLSNDPFPQTSPGSDRSWANPTYTLNSIMPGTTTPSDRYGETVTTTVAATNTSPAACRAWGAVFFSTEVADADDDGLPDGLEEASGGLRDPDGAELPNLNAMGALPTHRDLFVEFNSTWAEPETTYGSVNAPYPNTTADCYDAATQSCTDSEGHHHIPTPEVLTRLGDRYAANGIKVHFDVGNVAAYHALGQIPHTDWVDNYALPVGTTPNDKYLVPSNLARGGELIKEVACDAADPHCTFPDYPGTVGWKIGLLAHRNAPVGDDGEELNSDLTDPNDPSFNWINSEEHRLRFDRVRRPYFHYGLNAHARGTPSSPFPCLVNGQPAGYAPNGTCSAPNTVDNPQFHVPSGSRGLADLPGRNMLLTLGLWDEFVGRPFARAGAIFHELGHNMNLWHSGIAVDFGDADEPTVIPPNCNPNILSSMSYLYSVHGFFDPTGNIQLDYSGEALLPALAENQLFDGAYSTTPQYQRAWYAPAGSALALNAGVEAATRFCTAAPFGPGQPAQQMARVVSDTYHEGTWSIDWDGDGQVDQPSPAQDVNFDGVVDGTPSFYSQSFPGFNDWNSIRLDQISANGLGGGIEDFMLVGSLAGDDLLALGGDDLLALGGDDLIVYAGDDLLLFAGDDLLVFAGDDLLLLAGDDLIVYAGDDLLALGGDDLLLLAGDVQPEPTYAGAKGLGRTDPYGVSACVVGTTGCFETEHLPFTPLYHRNAVSWEPAIVGHIDHYQVQRRRADAPNGSYEDVGTTTANFLIDEDVLPKLSFVYRVRAHFDDPSARSGWAYLRVPIEARNDLPTPQADSYVTTQNQFITVPAPGVLGVSCTSNSQCTQGHPGTNADRSSDNPTAYVASRAVLVNGPFIQNTTTPSGTLAFNANGNGGFTFTPANAFTGFVTFTYKANDGFWSVDPTVPMNGKDGANDLFSNPVTVTIQVKKPSQK